MLTASRRETVSQAKEIGKTMVYLRSKKKLCHWGITRDKNAMRKDQQANAEPCRRSCAAVVVGSGVCWCLCGQAAGAGQGFPSQWVV